MRAGRQTRSVEYEKESTKDREQVQTIHLIIITIKVRIS